MNSLELARWQFGITTVYHFIFVPLTIGLALFTAVCQTWWMRTGKEQWLRATKFWGKLLLISFALGVATGIVQEFQFGMNWADYSRYVGDVFGAPLAMEGLAAFFVESTFLGLWIFGWGRLSKRVHLACAWLVAGSTMLSAYFILAANSWMQHPVGVDLAKARADGRAELTDIGAVLTNSTAIYAFAHVILAAMTTGGMVILAVSAWNLRKQRHVEVFRPTVKIALVAVTVGVFGTMMVGHFQGDLLEDQQPMKMAAADAVFEDTEGAGLSVFATGDLESNPGGLNRNIEIPKLLSLIATNDPDGLVRGINPLQEEYSRPVSEGGYGPGNYVPIVAVTYWTWRAMIGAGTLMFVIGLVGLFLLWRRRLERTRWFLWALVPAAALPFIANSAGWIFTEMGRQPWIVQGLLKTEDAVSPLVSSAEVIISLSAFVVVYSFLAAIGLGVFLRTVRKGPPEVQAEEERKPDLTLAY